MLFEDTISEILLPINNLDIDQNNYFQSDVIDNYLSENMGKINESLLINGVYNYIKYNNNKFLKESFVDYSIAVKKVLQFMNKQIKEKYERVIKTLKTLNRDERLSNVIIQIILDKKEKQVNSIKGSIQDYYYSIPNNSSYCKYFEDFATKLKVDKINEIDQNALDKYKKYNSGYFNKLRGKLVGQNEVNIEDFTEAAFKYFRSNEIELQNITIDSSSISKPIEEFKTINKDIERLTLEYGKINSFYLIAESSIQDRSFDSILDNQTLSGNEKLLIDYARVKNSVISNFLSIYNTYFIERLIAVESMYKSYYNRCTLYYNALEKERLERE